MLLDRFALRSGQIPQAPSEPKLQRQLRRGSECNVKNPDQLSISSSPAAVRDVGCNRYPCPPHLLTEAIALLGG